MEKTGEVTAVYDGHIQVTFCRPTDCEKCGACHGGQKAATLLVEGTAKLGDFAVVEMPVSTVVQASTIAYALPLAGLLGGLFIGFKVTGSDLGAVAGGLLGLGAAMLYLKLSESKRKQDPRWKPVLTRIIPKEEGVDLSWLKN